MISFDKLLEQYDYKIPAELIAQQPASPRDSARLLVYDRKTKKTYHDYFYNLPEYLPQHSVFVLNQTKVVPARLPVKKSTGGSLEILYIGSEENMILALSNKVLKAGVTIFVTNEISLEVLERKENIYKLRPSFSLNDLFKVFEKYGKTPLPPYIKHSPLSEKKLQQEYQTIFAQEKGSVAAPTASLHFTKELLQKITKAGHQIEYVTLHVNLGTFAPLKEEHVKTKKLHIEYYSVTKDVAERLNAAKKEGRPIVAVGTTVVRTLESAAKNGTLKNLSGNTSLFIDENYLIQFVDVLITNFHVPKSSLLMLVSAFVQREKLLALYEEAIEKKYRFFSFGDGMLIK